MENSQNDHMKLDAECESEELISHYSFYINDLALNEFGITQENLNSVKVLLLTTLAQEAAKELKDNCLIEYGDDRQVILYDIEKNKEENQNSIINRYLESKSVPEDILFLSEDGIDYYSKNIDKIEKHKEVLEDLTENIHELILTLIKIDNNQHVFHLNNAIVLDGVYNLEEQVTADEDLLNLKKVETILEHFQKNRENLNPVIPNKMKNK